MHQVVWHKPSILVFYTDPMFNPHLRATHRPLGMDALEARRLLAAASLWMETSPDELLAGPRGTPDAAAAVSPEAPPTVLDQLVSEGQADGSAILAGTADNTNRQASRMARRFGRRGHMHVDPLPLTPPGAIQDVSSPSALPAAQASATAPAAAPDVPGVTVITHGFQVGDDDGDSLIELAQDIVARTGGCLRNYELGSEGRTGRFIGPNPCVPGSQEIVVLFDWAAESNELSRGWTEAAADALFTHLILEGLVDPRAASDNYPLHFIGHSFGSAVTSEVVERLAGLSIPVDHVTYLDPHDFDEGLGASIAGVGFDTAQEQWTLGKPSIAGVLQESYGATVWNNVQFADVYYQVRRAGDPLIASYIPSGRPIPGAYNRLLDEELPPVGSYSLFSFESDHSYAWACFYRATVRGSLPPGCDAPQVPVDYASTGYGLSRVAGGESLRPDPVLYGADQDHRFSAPSVRTASSDEQAFYTTYRAEPDWAPTRIANGDFEAHGRDAPHAIDTLPLTLDIVPGWSHHGGGGEGNIGPDRSRTSNANHYLQLDAENSSRAHNLLYVPHGIEPLYLALEMRRVTAGADDRLLASLTDPILALRTEVGQWEMAEADAEFHSVCVPLPEHVLGTVQRFAFELSDAQPGGAVSSVVRIDNVAFAESCASPAARVVQRGLFYGNSAFDIPGAANLDSQDAPQIAPDKRPLLPGQSASPDNYSNYVHGINGLVIDVEHLAEPERLTLDDLQFRVGNASDLSAWQAAPDPIALEVLPGGGRDGSVRILLRWADGAIRNSWLEVTLRAGEHTGLREDDRFYFGNAVGETGNSLLDTYVDGTDFARIRDNQSLDPVAIDSAFDVNRDGRVDAVDLAIVRLVGTNFLTALRWIAP